MRSKLERFAMFEGSRLRSDERLFQRISLLLLLHNLDLMLELFPLLLKEENSLVKLRVFGVVVDLFTCVIPIDADRPPESDFCWRHLIVSRRIRFQTHR